MSRFHAYWLVSALTVALVSTLLPSCSSQKDNQRQIIWYINPETGSDHHSGVSAAKAWKTFKPLNKTSLLPGHKVVVAPGHHSHSLVPQAAGTAEQPVIIEFLPGRHEFGNEHATRETYFISNSVTAASKAMPIAILAKDCEHLQLLGGGITGEGRTTLTMTGRMVHFINDHSTDIHYQNLVFDLNRPTVSEFLVIKSGENWSDIRIVEGSTYQFDGGTFRWTGDIGSGRALTQEAIPEEGRAWRVGVDKSPLDQASRIEETTANCFRLYFDDRPPLTPGHQFQTRHLGRDIVGAHNNRSRNISITDCEFNAFAGMGIISQFTENIRYERVRVVPPAGTLRTCPAWADVFHFSGCRGEVVVSDCTFSGTQDDPINIHGTHLQIIEWVSLNQLLVSFAHDQTYGFAPFVPGDEVAVIQASTLREYPDNPRRTVSHCERISEKEWLVSLDGAAPDFAKNDVLDNLSWYPNATIRNNTVEMCSTRGFLVTSRGKVLIEGNTLKRCRMPGILIENDASGWFESGPVRDMTIRNNTLIGCDIRIHPRVKQGNAPVHENIHISNNLFTEGAGIHAHHTSGLVIENNRSDGPAIPIKLDPESTTSSVRNNP